MFITQISSENEMIRGLEVKTIQISILCEYNNGIAFIPTNQVSICIFSHSIVKNWCSG